MNQLKEKLVMIQHFGVLVASIGIYSTIILDLITVMLSILFLLTLRYLANGLDEDGTIRRTIKLKEFFSFKCYTKKGFK